MKDLSCKFIVHSCQKIFIILTVQHIWYLDDFDSKSNFNLLEDCELELEWNKQASKMIIMLIYIKTYWLADSDVSS